MTILLLLLAFWFIWRQHSELQKLKNEVTALKQQGSVSVDPARQTETQGAVRPMAGISMASMPLESMPLPPAPPANASTVFEHTTPSDHPTAITHSTQSSSDALLKWLTTDWLLKLGAALVLIGLGWFVTYAFAENWIGPVGRVTLGYVAGIALLVYGESRGKKVSHQASVLLGLGAATVLLTTFAAREVYAFFTPLSATTMMFAAAAVVAVSSVVHQRAERAVLGFLLAIIVPFLTASTEPNSAALLSYLFIVIAGTVWVISLTGWRVLLSLASVSYCIYSIIALLGFQKDDGMLLLVVIAFNFLLYAVTLVLHTKIEKLRLYDILPPVITAAVWVFWCTVLVAEEWRSLGTVAIALSFFLGAYLLYQRSKQRVVVLEYAGIALALLAAAAAFELDGPVFVIVQSVLTSVAVGLTWFVTRREQDAQKVGLLYLLQLPQLVSLIENAVALQRRMEYVQLAPNGGAGMPDPNAILNEQLGILVAVVVLAVQLGVLGYFFYTRATEELKQETQQFAAVYLISALALTLYSVWFAAEIFIKETDVAHGVALVVSTVVGLCLYSFGRRNRYKKTLWTGGAVLGVVIVRLLLVEIYGMDLFERVIVFLLVGGLLMGSSLIRPVEESR